MRASAWITVTFILMCIVTFILYIGAYVYCLLYDREALRSETYLIQKLAIERKYLGDNVTGTIEGEKIQGFDREAREADKP